MVKQITIDNNNVVQACSIGGYITSGIDVEDIPQEVMECPHKFCYVDGVYSDNADYTDPVTATEITIDDLVAAVAELAEVIANG